MLKPGGHWLFSVGYTLGRQPRMSGSIPERALPHRFLMARYRIVQRPGPLRPKVRVFAVEEKFLLWWQEINFFATIEEAKQFIEEVIETNKKPVVTKHVVAEYD